uniref:CYTH domain-containing protein n=1 Tax=Naja naja TaxID=35670 RepID=A0A8C7E711_NAJNA
MPTNVEIKARVQDLALLISRVEQLSGSPGSLILQTDTFFRVPHGRLKVRDFRDGHGQLVFYDRPNSTAPKLSHFTISPTDDPRGLVVTPPSWTGRAACCGSGPEGLGWRLWAS